MTKPKAYALLWMTYSQDEGLMAHTLVYRGGDGGVRTYYEGHLDGRAGDEDSLPRFDTLADAMDFFQEHLGDDHKALVEVSVAKRIRQDTYAEPV